MKIIVGSPIPLSLSTVDNAKGLTVIASVVDCYGKQIASDKLSEVAPGIYVSLDVRMPDVPFVIVQYFVQGTDLYEVEGERFDSEPKPSDPVKFIDGEVTSRGKMTEYVSGEVLK